jgi:hypothetical protein
MIRPIVAVLLLAGAPALVEGARIPPRPILDRLPAERPDDPPGVAAKAAPGARVASTIPFGRFTSIQVNVTATGADIIGDAANEPSLAVDPNQHDRMVIGWRQFDTIASNFREAGFAYTTNGGATWTRSEIQPGVFHSDPVLDVDDSGRFFYNALRAGLRTEVYTSPDGATWSPPVFASGGDKQWMTVDRELGHAYQAWSTASNGFAPNTFNKSIDDGASFSPPSFIPGSPIWGTLDVASDHTLYLVGWGDDTGGPIVVSRSDDAQSPSWDAPTWTSVPVDLGGFLAIGGPNPVGLLGQLWIGVDRSGGARDGWVYVLASVQAQTDPLDVHFIRSTDGGQTWSAPRRVNDDAPDNGAFQWFGTMSVAPNGRVDAVWNDTRGSADINQSALFYSWSGDGGTTWSPNEQVTPTWSSTVGWPNQQKIGDYYDMTSDDTGADVAYAATFNGGQDVYYVRIPNAAPVAVGDGPARVSTLRSSPNPFTGSTRIRFAAPREGSRARIEVFDLRGRLVATLMDAEAAGETAVSWDGRRHDGSAAAPGVYFCRLEVAGRTETRKLLRLP